jgi:hypothetical protein
VKNSNVSNYLAIIGVLLFSISLLVIGGYILYFVSLIPWDPIYEYVIKEITTMPIWFWPFFVALLIVSIFVEVTKKD